LHHFTRPSAPAAAKNAPASRHHDRQKPARRTHLTRSELAGGDAAGDVCASGGRAVPIATRKQRVDAEARRLISLGATMIRVLEEEGLDHYAVAMKDPEGNEFDIN
jgi:Glyoxalase-like domain